MKVLRKGDRGDDVKVLQQALKDKGYDLAVDGIFGSGTEKVLRSFQRAHSLFPDAIAGPKTWAMLLKAGSNELKILDGHINTHITRRPGRMVKYIAIHFTAGGTSVKGSALATKKAFQLRKASADFVVDDAEIVQINPDLRNYYCWSVGDAKNVYSGGGRLYGVATNKNTISIEICSNLKRGTNADVPNHSGWTFTEASLENALKLVRYLMVEFGIPKENVVRHYDISGKPCPGVIGWNDAQVYDTKGKPTASRSDSAKWEEFHNNI